MLKFKTSNEVKLEQPSNILSIFFTFIVSNEETSIFSNVSQFLNNPAIFIVEEVLKNVIFKLSKEKQLANIYSIFLTFDVSKFDKFIDVNF